MRGRSHLYNTHVPGFDTKLTMVKTQEALTIPPVRHHSWKFQHLQLSSVPYLNIVLFLYGGYGSAGHRPVSIPTPRTRDKSAQRA